MRVGEPARSGYHRANESAVWRFDGTNKPSGKRMQMNEAAVYTVAKGKVVREEFYYHAEPGK